MEILAAIGEFLAGEIATVWLYSILIFFLLIGSLEALYPGHHAAANRRSRWPANLSFGAINIALMSLMPITGILVANWCMAEKIGLFNQTMGQGWISFAATILIRSFAGYAAHFLTHKIHFLWRLHRVHHTDTHLDVSTAFRSHPAELSLLVFSFAVIAAVFGLSPWGLIVYEIVESLNNIAQHSNLRLPASIDRAFRLVFVTPNMHISHHSSYQAETDSNYGSVFSFWDRLFGTYTEEPRGGYDAMKLGLDEVSPSRAASFWWQLASPLFRLKPVKDNPPK